MSRESEADFPGDAELPGALPEALRAELVAFRRDVHMHPELGNQEFRTTAALKARLEKADLHPRVLDTGTGLICDIGNTAETGDGAQAADAGPRPMLALRADIDALPIPDAKVDCAYRSTVPDRAHACGHDVHTTVVLGAGLVLAELHSQGRLPYPVRLIFQPAEEVLPGGAVDAIASGALEGVGGSSACTATPGSTPGASGCGTAPSPPPATGSKWRSTAPAATPRAPTSPPTSSPPPPASPPMCRPWSPGASTRAADSR
uniref:Peptidase M20 dimerisation domain-containing protein n=1 Tax=Streptomyces avermitilis TaxID=33903 RepID=A0A499VA21_STRAX|nr:hypothetical protein SAVMC3_38820 [Streptomyces avermitilis]